MPASELPALLRGDRLLKTPRGRVIPNAARNLVLILEHLQIPRRLRLLGMTGRTSFSAVGLRRVYYAMPEWKRWPCQAVGTPNPGARGVDY